MDLEYFSKQTEIIVPKNSLVYQNTLGKTSIRFIDYQKDNNHQESEEYQEELTETMIEYITLEGKYYPIKRKFYRADGLIADDDELLEIEALALQKGKIEEDERLAYDTLRNIVVIELIEEENEIIDQQKEKLDMMEDDLSTAASPTPFTISQPMRATHSIGGNLPRPLVTQINRPVPSQTHDESIYFRLKGRPYPIEKPYKFQGQASGQILNIVAHDPQLWNSVIDVWKYPIVA